MRLRVWALLVAVLSLASPAGAHSAVDSLEARLTGAEGAERLTLLADLVEATHRDAPERALDYGDEALAALDRQPDPELRTRLLLRLGQAHFYRGDLDAVRATAERLTAISSPQALGNAALLEGMAENRTGGTEKAQRSFERAIALYETTGDDAGRSRALTNLGFVLNRQGEWGEARRAFQTSLALSERLGDARGVAAGHHNVGNTYRYEGDYATAARHIERGFGYFEAENDLGGMAYGLTDLALIRYYQGDYAAALGLLRRALPVREGLPDPGKVVVVHTRMGMVHGRLGDLDAALASYRRARAVQEENGETVFGNMGEGIGNGAALMLDNSVVAGNTELDCSNSFGTVTALHTLVEDGTCITPGQDGNLAGDPLLGPLADNGGPTFTHLPELGSPLVDAGSAATCPDTDQRGLPRDDQACDIGSVERQQAVADYDLEATPTTPLTVAPGGSVSFAYAITNNTPSPVSGDLYFVAETSTGQVVQGRIRSGTLPGGGTIAGSYTQAVPSSTPAGVYTYRLVIGQFPSGSVDAEVFALTVSQPTARQAAQGGVAAGDAVSTPRSARAPQAGLPASLRSGTSQAVPLAKGDSRERPRAAGGTVATDALTSAESVAASYGAPWPVVEAEAVASSAALPTEVALHAAFPNPTSGRATLGFDLPEAARVRLVVYDVLGREVARLVDGEVAAGRHRAVLDGARLADGTYLAHLTTKGGAAFTRRLTLLR